MRYRTLGKTGLRVSEIGFGGEWLARHERSESAGLIRYAHEKGINLIDCWMSDPKSRDIIGDAIHDCREEWFVQGHIGSVWRNEQYDKTRELAVARSAFEDLLRRLRTDYIDLGMIHFCDSEEEWDSIQGSDYLKYVFELKEKGVIRHIGMSCHNPRVAVKAARSGYVEMLLFSINPAFDMLPGGDDMLEIMLDGRFDDKLRGIDPERASFYKVCEENGAGLTVMKPFAGGRLLDAARSPFGVALSPLQCIHYALSVPAVASALCGYDTTEQIDEAVRYETADDEEKEYVSALAGAPLHSFKGQCTYCGHCDPCPARIDVAMVNKYYDLAVMQKETPESVRSHYLHLEHHASECLGCGSCERRCPFSVKVTDRMKQAAELFGK